jgi:hypothetical protein
MAETKQPACAGCVYNISTTIFQHISAYFQYFSWLFSTIFNSIKQTQHISSSVLTENNFAVFNFGTQAISWLSWHIFKQFSTKQQQQLAQLYSATNFATVQQAQQALAQWRNWLAWHGTGSTTKRQFRSDATALTAQ